MTKPKTKKRAHSVLGLTLSDGQLRACHVTRGKSGLEVVKTVNAALALDLLHPEPELVGREIKNHLDAAGIRERHCVVGIPPRWIMSQHLRVPELSPEDLESLLGIEAEKGFPVDPAQLQLARSFERAADGRFVTQLAVRREQIAQLGAVLKAAGLKPVSYTLGLAVLARSVGPDAAGRITLAAETTGVTILVSAGGVAALRTFDTTVESEAGVNLVNSASIGRELRITFEQVAPELRAKLQELSLVGDSAIVRQLAESLAPWARSAGLRISRGDLPEKSLGAELAEQIAGAWLETGAFELEFLPPRPSRWELLMARYNSGRLATVGFAAAAAAVIALGAFGWHEYQLWSLRSQWAGMRTQVTALDAVRARTREFSPWYDTSFRSLSIIKRVTECFPDNGSVTAKSFEVRNNSIVTINGTARDNTSLLHVQEALRKSKEVQALKIEQIRGKTPMQFTLTFRWNALSGT